MGHLFLLRVLGLGLGLGSLLPGTLVPGVGARESEFAESALLALGQVALLDLLEGVLEADAAVDGDRGRDLLGDLALVLGQLDVLGGAVELLVLAGLAGEQDQAGLVGLEARDVGRERFLVGVLAACVDRDTDGRGEFAGDAGFLFSASVSLRSPVVCLVCAKTWKSSKMAEKEIEAWVFSWAKSLLLFSVLPLALPFS